MTSYGIYPSLTYFTQRNTLKVYQCCQNSIPFYGWVGLHCVYMSSVAQLCRTLCDPMDCSTPGLLVHHQLPEFIQTHVLWVGDAIQPSHPLSSTSPPTFNLSQQCVCVCVCVYHVIFTHSSVSGHLDCFHMLGVLNNAEMNIGMDMSFQIIVVMFFG